MVLKNPPGGVQTGQFNNAGVSVKMTRSGSLGIEP